MVRESPKVSPQLNIHSEKKKKLVKKSHSKKLQVKGEPRKQENQALVKASKIFLKTEVVTKTTVSVPKTNDDASCNWRSLCSKLTPNKIIKRKAAMPRMIDEAKSAKLALSDDAKSSRQQKLSESASTVWFDDVDPLLLSDTEEGKSSKHDNR